MWLVPNPSRADSIFVTVASLAQHWWMMGGCGLLIPSPTFISVTTEGTTRDRRNPKMVKPHQSSFGWAGKSVDRCVVHSNESFERSYRRHEIKLVLMLSGVSWNDAIWSALITLMLLRCKQILIPSTIYHLIQPLMRILPHYQPAQLWSWPCVTMKTVLNDFWCKKKSSLCFFFFFWQFTLIKWNSADTSGCLYVVIVLVVWNAD